MHYIYIITCLVNNKVYIGQAKDPASRWSKHKSAAKHNYINQVITRAIRKHGVSNFAFEVIASCLTQEDANHSETEIIAQYDACDPLKGYNVDRGGEVFPPKPEILTKISSSLRRFYATHANSMKGKSLPESWKRNIAAASIGKAGANSGKKFSAEWSAKISKANAGKSKKSTRRFAQQVELDICKKYSDGGSIYHLGKEYQASRSLIIQILDRNHINRRESNYSKNAFRRNRFTKEQELEICKIYLSGNTNRAAIGRQFNCNANVITLVLTRHKLLGAHNEETKE